MLNQRGSALLNVMAVIVMLLILGFGLMAVVNADAVIARRDSDVACAFQMAEGGVDFGLEMLVAGPQAVIGAENWPLVGQADSTPLQPFLLGLEEGDTLVTVEEVELNKYLITSKAARGSAARTIEAEVTYYESDNPFSYSVFVAGNTEESVLNLKNLTIHGPVYISAKEVNLESVTFNGDVHFNAQTVNIWSPTTLNVGAVASCEPDTDINIMSGNVNKHWSNTIIRESDLQTLPQIPISEYSSIEGFKSWTGSTVAFHELETLNYFPGDVTIELHDDIPPLVTKAVVASSGSVSFANAGGDESLYHPVIDSVLIIMAEENITDVEKITNTGSGKYKSTIDLYLYAKGDIVTEQSVYLSSVMAQAVSFHSQKDTIEQPDPRIFDDLPDKLRQDWGLSGFHITNWSN